MAKKDDTETTAFNPAPLPRGPEKPLAAAGEESAAAKPAPTDGKIHARDCALATDEACNYEGYPALRDALVRLVVDGWFNDCIKGGPIGRHTQSYNHLHGALDELKRRLGEHLKRED